MAMRPTINRHQIELDEYAFALCWRSGQTRTHPKSPSANSGHRLSQDGRETLSALQHLYGFFDQGTRCLIGGTGEINGRAGRCGSPC
jgi:hypothetical protein